MLERNIYYKMYNKYCIIDTKSLSTGMDLALLVRIACNSNFDREF